MAKNRLEVLLQIRDLASTEVKKFDRNTKAAAKGVKNLDTRMKSLGSTARRIKMAVGGLFAGIGGALVLRDMTRTIAGFEKTMATVRGVTGATGDEFMRLSDRARELGATTQFSAQEAGEGLLFLARAGFDTQQSLEAVGSTLDLAIAGALDLGRAADIASNVVSQFGLDAAETERVVDTLITTANSANTNVEQLAEAMKMAGPVAGALGQSVETTAAALGVLGDSGIQASLAGTNLRGTMAALLKPTDDGLAAIKEMGLSIRELDPATNTVIQVFSRFSKANLTAANAVALFGRRNAAAALVLTRNVGKIRELTAANEEAEGTANKMARMMEDTLAGSMKSLRSAIEELYLATGDDGLGGTLRALTDTLTGTVRVLAGMDAKAAKASATSKALAVAIKQATVFLGAFVAVRFVAFMGGVVASMIQATAVTNAFTAALAINPVTAWTVAISGLATALFFLATDAHRAIDEVKEYGDEILRITDVTKRAADALAGLENAAKRGDWAKAGREVSTMISIVEKKLDDFRVKIKAAADPELVGVSIKELVEADPLFMQTQVMLDRLDEIRERFPGIDEWTAQSSALFGTFLYGAEAVKGMEQWLTLLKKRLDETSEKAGGVRKALRGINDETKEANELARARESAFTNLAKYLHNLGLEVDLLRIRNREGQVAADLEFVRLLALKAGITATKEQMDAVRALLDERRKLTEVERPRRRPGTDGASMLQPGGFDYGFAQAVGAFETHGQRMAMLGQDVASAMGNAFQVEFFDPMENRFRRLNEIVRDFAANFLQALSQIAANQLALSLLRGLGGALGLTGKWSGGDITKDYFTAVKAKGGVFSGGHEMATFARGGVVNFPTVFPMARGAGLMGEAGPEAILPLKRGPGGRLGVEAGGGRAIVMNQTLNFNGPTDEAGARRGAAEGLRAFKRNMLTLMGTDGDVRVAMKSGSR